MSSFRNGLAGLVLLGASTLSGCGSLIDFAARENAAKIEADSRVRAAEINAGTNRLNSEARRKIALANRYKSAQTGLKNKSEEIKGVIDEDHKFIACEYVKDANVDGHIEPNEIFGQRDNYKPGESITFLGTIFGLIDRTLRVDLVLNNGEETREFAKYVIPTSRYDVSLVYKLKDDFPEGSLEARWYVNDKHIGSSKVTVSKTSKLDAVAAKSIKD
ncbi:MAG: hypothetical protein ACP5NS_04625 [Candidatus Pacearchaeota archaeon]